MSPTQAPLHKEHPETGPMPEALSARMAEAWPKAQAHWSHFLLLSPPLNAPTDVEIAQIHLGTRQIYLNGKDLLERNLLGSLEGILAHEIGHHVRYPGSLATSARLRLLERSLLPLEGYSVVNLFCDLLINEQLGETLRDQLVAVYRAFPPGASAAADPAFLFYLAVYEELWQLAPGHLMGEGRAPFEKRFPDYRADAQLVAQNLFSLGPNLFTQFVYFLSMVGRYLRPLLGELPKSADPYQCSCGEPSPDDWADALTPGARELEAVRRALEEGWIEVDAAERVLGPEALEERIAGLPGSEGADAEAVPEVMAAYYRLQAEKYLLSPPPAQTLGEAVVPTTLDPWEPGDPVHSIDWPATLQLHGPALGAAQPLRRERIADYEGQEVPLWQPRVEIYLDVSGSMPDPRRSLNAMTLAAQILVTGALRAGGWGRALLYSAEAVAYWSWCRSEAELSRFLMHYVGGGTEFPFGKLADSVRECGAHQPTRVVITDRDFDRNYQAHARNGGIFAEAAQRSAPLVLLLHAPKPERVALYRSRDAQVVEVHDLDAFPRMAAQLAKALFAEGGPHVAS